MLLDFLYQLRPKHIVGSLGLDLFTMYPACLKMIPERYVMVLLCAACCFINYADRVNMSVAIIAIAEDYKFTVEQQGIIMSSFFLGYLPMQVGGAVLSRRFGGKRVLSYGAFLWSSFTILTPLSCHLGYHALLLCRILMGLSEGVAFPSVFHFLSHWVPANERSRAIAIFLSGVHIGTTVALLLSPMIIRWKSWQFIFYSFGAVGMLWIVLWNLVAYDRDSAKMTGSGPIAYTSLDNDDEVAMLGIGQSRRRTSQELLDENLTSAGNTVENRGGPIILNVLEGQAVNSFLSRALKRSDVRSVMFILTNTRCMALCITQALFGLIHYTIMSWLPSYFKYVYKMETTSLSFTFLPYFAMAVSANIGGVLSDQMVSRGMSLTKSRKIVTCIANIGAAVMMLAFTLTKSVNVAVGLISLSMAFMSLNSGGFESIFLDMASPELTGILKAVANTMGSFSGLIAVPFATLVLKWADGSWRVVFGTLCGWFGVMTFVFCWFGSSDRVLTEQALKMEG